MWIECYNQFCIVSKSYGLDIMTFGLIVFYIIVTILFGLGLGFFIIVTFLFGLGLGFLISMILDILKNLIRRKTK